MPNFTFPSGANSTVDYLAFTNQITSSWGMTIWSMFFTFVLPLTFFIMSGNDKLESVMVSAFISGLLMYFLSLTGLIASQAVIAMFLLSGAAFVLTLFRS